MNKSILVVEDEKILRISLADALKEEGYTVLAVPDGEEAISAIKQGAFSLIITDIRLPGYQRFGNITSEHADSAIRTGNNDDCLRQYQGCS